jgi:predicted ATPase
MSANQFIKNVRVRNFKSISEAAVSLAPLNVVVGRNSAGKSSLMHSILLATQHLSSDFIADNRISLNRNVVSLGTFREVLNFSQDLDETVSLAIETQNSSWSIDFAQNRDSDGEPLLHSREATIRRVEFNEKTSTPNRSRLKQLGVSFDVSEFPIRTTPVLLNVASSRRSEMPLAIGQGRLNFSAFGAEEEVSRPFDLCLFLPYAQSRIHPLPLEKVDFFHHVVERFFAICVNRSRMTERRRRVLRSASLVAETSNEISRSLSELVDFFTFLVSSQSSREEPRVIPQPIAKGFNTSLSDRLSHRDAIEESASRIMNRIFSIRRQPWVVMRDYSASSKSTSSGQELLTELCVLASQVGISELKSVLVPTLQALYGVDELVILKPLSVEFSDIDSEDDESIISDDALIDFLERGRDRLTRAAKNVYYLGPIRDVEYPAVQLPDPRNLGPKGEQAVEVLVHEANTVLDFPLPNSFEQGLSQVNFNQALSAWLNELELAKGVKSEDQGRDKPRMVVQIDDHKNSVDIRSVGQGISQLLPVLMQCLLAAPGGSLVIVEQPELHLHPKLESRLADFFIACARTGRQIFVETHSEHLINQLRLRIAEDQTDETRDLIQVLFADQVDGVTSFNQALIDPYGGLEQEQWPQGFLELNVNAAEKLIDAAIDKKINELENSADSDDAEDVDDDEDDF